MAPMWSRTARFANIYAIATLDSVSSVLWLSAWAAVASYVGAGKGKGSDTKASGCDNFQFGSPGRCKLSEATIVLGVFIMLLFCTTAFISFKSVMHFRRTGILPTNIISTKTGQSTFGQETQDAFQSHMGRDEFDQEDDQDTQTRPGRYNYGNHPADDRYAPLHHDEADDLGAPAHHGTSPLGGGAPQYGQQSNVMHDHDTSYGGAFGRQSPNLAQPPSYTN